MTVIKWKQCSDFHNFKRRQSLLYRQRPARSAALTLCFASILDVCGLAERSLHA
jgi:hypothetical protein